ncbi:sickle tail protein isoform X1 [Tachysurus ichikawai]
MLSSLQCELNIQRYLLKIESLHQPRVSNCHSSKNRCTRTGVVCSTIAPAFSDQPDLGLPLSLDTLEVMSECDLPVAFTRGSRSRASLPVVRSANKTRDRSLGVLYLQHGDETKQIRMPNEITTVGTVQALFVSAFPQQLSMKMLESPSTAIYVKDDMRNMYYELSDVRSITDQSCLKVYHKDPAHAFSHAARPINGDARCTQTDLLLIFLCAQKHLFLCRSSSPDSFTQHSVQQMFSNASPLLVPVRLDTHGAVQTVTF